MGCLVSYGCLGFGLGGVGGIDRKGYVGGVGDRTVVSSVFVLSHVRRLGVYTMLWMLHMVRGPSLPVK